jgi:hypothetical protein
MLFSKVQNSSVAANVYPLQMANQAASKNVVWNTPIEVRHHSARSISHHCGQCSCSFLHLRIDLYSSQIQIKMVFLLLVAELMEPALLHSFIQEAIDLFLKVSLSKP